MGYVLGTGFKEKRSQNRVYPTVFVPLLGTFEAGPIRKGECGLFGSLLKYYSIMSRKRLGKASMIQLFVGVTYSNVVYQYSLR